MLTVTQQTYSLGFAKEKKKNFSLVTRKIKLFDGNFIPLEHAKSSTEWHRIKKGKEEKDDKK